MRLVRSIHILCSALALCVMAAGVSAAPADPKNGVDYLTLPTAQATPAGKKIEVIEFFAYYCPHCYAFETGLSAWVKKQGGAISFKRVHISYDARVQPQERLFFTLEAMGLTDQYQMKVFNAMHVDKLTLGRDEDVFNWAEKAGINRAKFIDTYRSFGVQTPMSQVDKMMETYKIDSWPMLIIDGRYKTSPSQANEGLPPNLNEETQQQAALQVASFLVAKAKAEKK